MVSDILTAISDDKSLHLFNTLAASSGKTDVLITKLGLKKQYYSRMSALTDAGLISRGNGKYFLTSFGKIVYEAQLLIEKAKQNYWKLRAIDSVDSSARGSSPLYGYMKSKGCSERHQNNTLQVMIGFANFLGRDRTFYDVEKKEQIIEYLDTLRQHQ